MRSVIVQLVCCSSLSIIQLLTLVQGQTVYSRGGCPPSSSCIPPPNLPNAVITQPFYAKFLPWTERYSTIDNECYTCFQMEGDNNTCTMYQSRVYNDGTCEVYSYLQYTNTSGILNLFSPQCTIMDTIFDQGPGCTFLGYRCYLGGGCENFDTDSYNIVPVFGLSSSYGALDPEYWDPIEQLILRRGFRHQRYYSMPMRYPPRCVTRQPCTLP